VEKLAYAGQLHRLDGAQRSAARRLLHDELARISPQFPDSKRIRRLEGLLRQL
jgi:hypothetical protein